MATAAVPARRRKGHPLSALGLRAASFAARLVAPHKAALRNLADIPLTVAAFTCVDAAAWTHSAFAGLMAAGPLLYVLEHLIADER